MLLLWKKFHKRNFTLFVFEVISYKGGRQECKHYFFTLRLWKTVLWLYRVKKMVSVSEFSAAIKLTDLAFHKWQNNVFHCLEKNSGGHFSICIRGRHSKNNLLQNATTTQHFQHGSFRLSQWNPKKFQNRQTALLVQENMESTTTFVRACWFGFHFPRRYSCLKMLKFHTFDAHSNRKSEFQKKNVKIFLPNQSWMQRNDKKGCLESHFTLWGES